MIARVDAAEGGKRHPNPRPAEGRAPDEAGAHGSGGGVGNMGRGHGTAMLHILLGNTGDPDGGLPPVSGRAGADLADTLDGLVGSGPVKEVLQLVAKGIPNADTQKGEGHPGFGLILGLPEEDAGKEKKNRGPKPAIGQKVEELVQNRVVEAAVDPAKNLKIQGIDLGDQLFEAKLGKMVRQAVCFSLIWTLLGPVLRSEDLVQPSVRLKAEKKDTSTWEAKIPENPTPRQMQNFLWRTLIMKDLILKGRVQSGERKIPVVVRTRDRLIQFEFLDRPLQIRVRFAPEGSLIQKRAKPEADWQVVTGTEKTKEVAGTDLAYEDLGIDFLRWPDAKLVGTDNIMMLDCWTYEANPPVESNYAKVRYWISKTYLTMIRADGLNAKGQAIKRFTFNSVIEAEDTVVIGEMKVASLTPGTDVSASRTFVQIETVEKGSGL